MKSLSRLATGALLLLASCYISGCASLGQTYSRAENVPEDSAVVYFYRPNSFIGSGISYDIRNGDTVITTLYNGGYYPYISPPGEQEFWARTESKASVTLDVQKGQTYYVKGELGAGFVVARPHLMVVVPEIAEKEIAKCRLIPKKLSAP